EFGLALHRYLPFDIALPDMHVDAQRLEGFEFCLAFLTKIAGETRHGQEVLGIHRCDMESAEASVGWTGNMKFPAFRPCSRAISDRENKERSGRRLARRTGYYLAPPGSRQCSRASRLRANSDQACH